jgi:hypothetical protein
MSDIHFRLPLLHSRNREIRILLKYYIQYLQNKRSPSQGGVARLGDYQEEKSNHQVATMVSILHRAPRHPRSIACKEEENMHASAAADQVASCLPPG